MAVADQCVVFTAACRYERFLLLHKECPGQVLVPMMDIDLMWHTHIGSGGVYTQDCNQWFGKLLQHDDMIPDSQLTDSFM